MSISLVSLRTHVGAFWRHLQTTACLLLCRRFRPASCLRKAIMSKRKGLSVEEKRSRMMEFFYEKKDVFQLKELEKLCQKEKGITSVSVKEVLQSLVDDGLVDTDKIGTSIYYWAFPSKASQKRKRKIEELEKSLEEAKAKRLALIDMIKQSTVGREDTDERRNVLQQIEEKNSEKAVLQAKLKQYEECDPEALEAVKQQAKIATEAANRWTDNIFSIKSWIKNKFSCEESLINKQFSIPEDLDYLS